MYVISRRAAQTVCFPNRACAVRTSHLSTVTTLIMGPPGGGKGTISKKLIKDFDFSHISTGDALRAHVRDGTPLGKQAKSYMDSGALVPDDLIISLMKEEISKGTGSDGKVRVLLDGFPRTQIQAESLSQAGVNVDVALNLQVPYDDIVARAANRWVHLASGRVYSSDYNPPKVDGKDDETGEELIQRDDDKPDTVRARLAQYDELTAPLCEYYAEQGVYKSFDGSTEPELVTADRRSDAIYKELRPFMEGELMRLE